MGVGLLQDLERKTRICSYLYTCQPAEYLPLSTFSNTSILQSYNICMEGLCFFHCKYAGVYRVLSF